MIHTSKQLKDKVRNISKGDNNIAKVLIRNFIMERFLERVSVSDYRNHFILKGGMLVASIIGIDMRATMDIDTTVKSLPVNADDAQRIVSEICAPRVDKVILLQAFSATCKKRETVFSKEEMLETLTMIEKDAGMAGMWERFRKRNYFVGDLEWKEVLNGVLDVIYTYIENNQYHFDANIYANQ